MLCSQRRRDLCRRPRIGRGKTASIGLPVCQSVPRGISNAPLGADNLWDSLGGNLRAHMNTPWFPAIVSGLVAAILTSIIAPAIQHFIWRRQKLREQKLAVAERLAGIVPKLIRLFDLDTERHEKNQLIGEIDALLFTCQVLFSRTTKEACYKLHLLLKQRNRCADKSDPIIVVDYFSSVYQAAADALAYAYGDVFLRKLKDNWWIPYSSTEIAEFGLGDE